MQDNDTPYLMRGTRQVATESSTLVSSSPYLNNPRLREWIATAYLRRSGKDRPTSADAYELHTILRDILDLDIHRGGVQQVKPSARKHALPGAGLFHDAAQDLVKVADTRTLRPLHSQALLDY